MARALPVVRRDRDRVRPADPGSRSAASSGRHHAGGCCRGLGGDDAHHQGKCAQSDQRGKSAPVLGIAAAIFGERMTAPPSALALGAFLYQTVWVVSITFTIWFVLVVRYSSARLSVFTFLAPLFGVAAGHFVLNEPLTPALAVAVALVAIGLLLVNSPR